MNWKYYVRDGAGRVIYRGGDAEKAVSVFRECGDRFADMRRVDAETGQVDGYGPYISRHFAKRAAHSDEYVVKVCGGWRVMSVRDYQVWAAQK